MLTVSRLRALHGHRHQRSQPLAQPSLSKRTQPLDDGGLAYADDHAASPEAIWGHAELSYFELLATAIGCLNPVTTAGAMVTSTEPLPIPFTAPSRSHCIKEDRYSTKPTDLWQPLEQAMMRQCLVWCTNCSATPPRPCSVAIG